MNETTKVAKRHSADGFIEDNKDTIHMRSKLGKLEANSLVNTATNTVAADGGFENFFRDDNTKALMMFRIGSKNKRKDRSADGLPFLISVADAATRMKTIFTREHNNIISPHVNLCGDKLFRR